jgi:hypothetical protein
VFEHLTESSKELLVLIKYEKSACGIVTVTGITIS